MKERTLGWCCLAGFAWLVLACDASAFGATRTWTAAAGGFSVVAELVEVADGKAVLKKEDGTTLKVPLEKLSDADRAFIKKETGVEAAPAAKSRATALNEEDSLKALKSLDKEAEMCNSAEEAAMLYTVFVADESVAMSVRSQAREKQAEWQARAEKSLVRHGKKWITVDEVRNARTQAAFLVNQGVEMVRLNQSQIGLEKLNEASKVDPDGIQADFVIATIYAIVSKNYDKAMTHYEICLRRDPNNVAVLNNLALCELRRAQFADAVNHWKKAAATRYDQRMAQNIGRILELAGQRRIAVPQSTLKQLSDVYASMVVANKVFGADKGKGWNYMLIPMPDPNEIADPTLNSAINSNDPNELTYLGAGTGFVVADKYILTTRSATKGGSVFLVSNPNSKGQMLTATLVASWRDGDLALLKCEGIAAAPIPLDLDEVDAKLVPDYLALYKPNEELSVLSYALSDTLGIDARADHGVIVMPPSRALQFMVQYNATVSGSPGGPVLNSMGNAVAVHFRGFNSRELHYASGIPIIYAALFMKESVPDIQFTKRNKADVPWTKVDEISTKSTVLVVAKGKAQDIGMAKDKAAETFLEDNSCVRCNGFKEVKCPGAGCSKGTVHSTRTSTYTVNGRTVTDEVPTRVSCQNCNGDGKVRCPDCHGSGIDPSFNRGGRESTLPSGVKARSTLNQ